MVGGGLMRKAKPPVPRSKNKTKNETLNPMIVIVDYRMGNVASIRNMLKKIGVATTISSEPAVIAQADKLILPGVGSFDHGMRSIRELGLLDLLHEKVLDQRTPVLGICLGMQLMTRRSEEGTMLGLGWLEADTIRFQFNDALPRLRVPHMGWNVTTTQVAGGLFDGLEAAARFYFVHSYHVVCDYPEDALTTTPYGFDFVSSFQRDHIFGTQFHPEKSHRYGMRLLQNFANL